MQGYLKVALGPPPVEDSAEKIAELAECEKQAVAEVGGEGGDVRDCDHLGTGGGEERRRGSEPPTEIPIRERKGEKFREDGEDWF